jgi:putative resolvase
VGAREGVHCQAAWRWWRGGKLPVPAQQAETGTIVVEVPAAGRVAGGAVVYAWVSWRDQRSGLGRQVARVTEAAAGRGLAVAEVVCEAGCGLDGRRPGLRQVLSGSSAAVIVGEHRDWLACFGAGHLGAGLAAQGRRVLVADPGEATDGLVVDMIGVLTSVCARLCGRRGTRSRAVRAVTAAKDTGVSVAA